ncbi:unnamed protein product [Merluccius merluccius]
MHRAPSGTSTSSRRDGDAQRSRRKSDQPGHESRDHPLPSSAPQDPARLTPSGTSPPAARPPDPPRIADPDPDLDPVSERSLVCGNGLESLSVDSD